MIDSLAPPNELYGGGHCPVHPGGAAGIQFGREGPGGYIVMSKVQSAMKHERRKEDVGLGSCFLELTAAWYISIVKVYQRQPMAAEAAYRPDGRC